MAPTDEQLKKIDERLMRIETHMKWERIFSVARFLIIAVPIILALIYIPPFVKRYIPLAEKLGEQAQAAARFLQKASTMPQQR